MPIKPVPKDVVVPDGMKWCFACKAVKPLEVFERSRYTRCGRMGRCRPYKRDGDAWTRDKTRLFAELHRRMGAR